MMRAMARIIRNAVFAALLALAPLFVIASPRAASAAPPWVDRPITLPRLVFAGDAGLGIAHLRFARRDFTGPGVNLEAAIGITDSVELGLRTGIRLGDDARALGADAYARTLFTETYGTATDPFANPELRVRWAAYSGRVVEVALDGRVYLPVEQGSKFGFMFGVPIAFHIADILRIDTGLYIPIVFNEPTTTVLSVPGYFWFQVSNKVWLGPMVGLRHIDPGGPAFSHDDFLLGFGLGYQVASSVDLKWMAFMPRVNADRDEPRAFGAGMGVQFRIGE
ncbi:MAG: hypothetical protein JWP87_4835 [Labilithrix sp.]|nr:hypothetical protein [Labilithrix sp.]